MPRITDLDSDGEMSGVEHEGEQTTPPPVTEKSFTSKADLMSGIVDEDIPDYDFDEDSDDSDLEIYGMVKPLAASLPSRSIVDTNDEQSVNHGEPGQELDSPPMLGQNREHGRLLQGSEDELVKETSETQGLGEEHGQESRLEHSEDEGSARAEDEMDKERGKLVNGKDIKHEEDISIKSEDETQSIDYGEGDDEESSTIDVQAFGGASPGTVVPAAGCVTSHGGRHDDLPWLSDAPIEVQTVLSKWFNVHGRQPPPCAGWPAPQYMRVSTSGKTAIWLHTSQEHMTPSMFQVPDLIDTLGVPTRRILVVQGPTRGPYIVAHTGGAGLDGLPNGIRGGSRFRVWLGIDSTDADGFEPGCASIWKGFAHNLGYKPHSGKVPSQKVTKSLRPGGFQPCVPNGRIGTPADSIPEQLKSQLEAWMAKYGRSYPPCTSHFPDRLLHQSSAGATATWWHESGEQLEPRGYSIDGRAYIVSEASLKRVIVVQGPTRGPYIIRYYKAYNNSEAIGYRIWQGVNGGDDLGFERGCSIFKFLGSVRPTQEDITRWQSGLKHKKGHSSDSLKPGISHHKHTNGADKAQNRDIDNQTTLRPRSSITAPSKYVPAKLAETRRAHYPHKQPAKRKRDEYDDDDRESLLNSFMSPAAEKIPQPLKASSRELVDHIKNNVVLLFFPQSGGAPRVRLLGSCDSVQKLFAQALAGDVFADGGGSGTKVLALTFGGGQKKSRSLVEDDDQDFDDLVTALKLLDGWVIEDSLLRGSLTVEVRAK